MNIDDDDDDKIYILEFIKKRSSVLEMLLRSIGRAGNTVICISICQVALSA